jgi:hypothetical protein
MWRQAVEHALEWELGSERLCLLGASAALAFMWFCFHVYTQLTVLRPFLVFVFVHGEPPPVCGLCVLFGTR